MEKEDFKRFIEIFNEAKPKRKAIVFIPSTSGFDMYEIDEDIVRTLLTFSAKKCSWFIPDSKTSSATKCQNCGKEKSEHET